MEPQAQQLKKWREHPELMVRELFGVTPDPWQDEVLARFPSNPRLAMKASKGVGKTSCLAWLCWNFLLTRPDPNIAATSISGDNLKDGLWKEMAVWRAKSELLMSLFEWQAERIFYKGAPATWWMSARSWPKTADEQQIGNTLAGLHSEYIMFVIDESGAIPESITMAAEAALSSPKEGHIIQAGNTNMLSGALYAACVKQRHMWQVVEINGDPDNPMRSPRISIEWAQEMIRAHGRDNPHVKVMVLGEWPTSSINALLGPEDVERAMARKYQQHHIAHAPKILGVDVARFGDDPSVIFPRQGLVAFKPHVMRNADSNHGAGHVARTEDEWGSDATFIDNTGGYGAGWIDAMHTLNRHPIGVGFAEKAFDPRYYNRRAEMLFTMAAWIKNEGALPDVPELMPQLTALTYSFKGDRLIIAPKDLIKAQIGRSTDEIDALALTFAAPVASRQVQELLPRPRAQPEYDPFRAMLQG